MALCQLWLHVEGQCPCQCHDLMTSGSITTEWTDRWPTIFSFKLTTHKLQFVGIIFLVWWISTVWLLPNSFATFASFGQSQDIVVAITVIVMSSGYLFLSFFFLSLFWRGGGYSTVTEFDPWNYLRIYGKHNFVIRIKAQLITCHVQSCNALMHNYAMHTWCIQYLKPKNRNHLRGSSARRVKVTESQYPVSNECPHLGRKVRFLLGIVHEAKSAHTDFLIRPRLAAPRVPGVSERQYKAYPWSNGRISSVQGLGESSASLTPDP
jgi:hypothetical protein